MNSQTEFPGPWKGLLALIALVALAPTVYAADSTLSLVLRGSVQAPQIVLSGLPVKLSRSLVNRPIVGEASKAIQLFVLPDDEGDAADGQAVFGQVRWVNGAFGFTPKYPLAEGVSYLAVFEPERLASAWGEQAMGELRMLLGGQRTVEATLRRQQAPTRTPARLVQIYPTQDTLPENQLKFYLHFSAPMSQSEAYGNIRLVRDDGKEVDYPFLKLEPELWDRAGQRLTLFIDPGRIKMGLKPREEAGPALEHGGSYRLMISRKWRDSGGQPLAADFVKSFQVGTPDAVQPAPTYWKIKPPLAGGKEPLIVDFDEPLDHAMLHRVLAVATRNGKPLAGSVAVSDDAKRWSWTPASAWRAGRHELQVSGLLEDLAGNSLTRPFEVDVSRDSKSQESKLLRLPFRVK